MTSCQWHDNAWLQQEVDGVTRQAGRYQTGRSSCVLSESQFNTAQPTFTVDWELTATGNTRDYTEIYRFIGWVISPRRWPAEPVSVHALAHSGVVYTHCISANSTQLSSYLPVQRLPTRQRQACNLLSTSSAPRRRMARTAVFSAATLYGAI